MRNTGLTAALLFAAVPAVAAPPITSNGEWWPLSPESSWSAWWPACIVQSSWDGPAADDRTALATLSISTVLGTETYFLSVSNDSWKSISEAENLSVAFGFDDRETAKADLPVLGFVQAGEVGPGFNTGVDADFLRRMAAAETMEVHLDGEDPVSFDMNGAAAAVEPLLACSKNGRARV